MKCSIPTCNSYLLKIARGMAFLGRENIVHRDLRAFNIMVGENYHAKVGGFSLARIMVDDIYFAPEGK